MGNPMAEVVPFVRMGASVTEAALTLSPTATRSLP